MNIFVKDGKVIKLTEGEAKRLKNKGKTVSEFTQNMTKEELAHFQKKRYEKFIKPLMKHNIQQINKPRP